MKAPSLYLRLVPVFFLIVGALGFYFQWNYYRLGLNWESTFSDIFSCMSAFLLVVLLTLWALVIVFLERKMATVSEILLKFLGALLLPITFFFFLSVGPFGSDRYLRGLHDRLDQTCTEPELWDWSENLRNSYQGREERVMDELDALPVCLAELAHNKPHMILDPDGQLILGWPDFGSSIYGIIFSKRTAKMQSDETIRRLEWKSGIDVFFKQEE